MNTVETISDAALVADSLTGDREAFGRIVARYQTLICSLAYSGTGSLSQSEDLAQETFLAAWKQLTTLREPHKLRSWLCAIARNRIYDALKKQHREPSHSAEPLDAIHESPAPELLPHDLTIRREEEVILWHAIERIPETYREPLILFYRENQSVETVAENLELSGDAVKQRLARGRKLLQEQVLAFVEGALARTNPGPAFTLGVLAVLPAFTFSTKAAALGAVAKGAAVKGATLGSAFGWLLGPVIGLLCAYAGWRTGLKNTRTPRERALVVRNAKIILVGAAIFAVSCGLLPGFIGPHLRHPLLTIGLGLAVVLGWVIFVFAISWRYGQAFIRLREEERQLHPELFQGQPDVGPMLYGARWEYRSRATLFGLPLIHCRSGRRPGEKIQPAVGWIAFGEIAYGILFANGGLAVGAISLGGASLGIISFGGFGVGLLAFGGLAFGGVALGGAAIGLIASGGIALGWHAALGGLVAAHELGLGGAVVANHANDDAAQAFFLRYHWLNFTQPGPRNLFWLLCFAPVVFQILFWNWWCRKMSKQA